MAHHIVSQRLYLGVFALLIVLTGVTTAVAFIDLGRFNTPLALTIATIKALLVILYFMHLRYSSRLTQVVVAVGFFWFAILIALTLSDYMTRGWQAVS